MVAAREAAEAWGWSTTGPKWGEATTAGTGIASSCRVTWPAGFQQCTVFIIRK